MAAVVVPYPSPSLYVGDLSTDVTEANLYEIFSAVGTVTSIRVCRDAITRRSLGYAYVNYHNVADAERAQEQLNNSPIKDRPCRIMWSQRDPSLRKSGKGNIFIKNLDSNIDHKALHDTFIQFGEILSCKVELDDANESKGYGYIQFATGESAEKAIQKVNGMMLNGKKVYVGPFIPRKERIAANSSREFTNVFVKNLDLHVDDDKLFEVFSPYGPIKSHVVMRNQNNESKGFGFVNFEIADDAARAVDELNGLELNGKPIFVGRAQKRMEREAELRQKFENLKMEQMSKYQGVNLYVKNLEDDVDEEKLRNIFAPFGAITSAKVMTDARGASRCFGFVCFSTPEEATRAVTELNGKIIGTKPLYVALAQRKDQRKAQLEMQFAQRKQVMPRMPAPMFNNGGPPMFYPPAQPGFVYPQMMPHGRGRFGPGFQPMPYMMMPNTGRGHMKTNRGGMKQRGMKQQQQQPMLAPDGTPVMMVMPQPLSDDHKQAFGQRIYEYVADKHPEQAGKVTGMILDSYSTFDDLNRLVANNEELDEKVEEALKVLKEHSNE